MTFLNPLGALIPEVPFSFFFPEFWVRVTSGARGSVSVGFGDLLEKECTFSVVVSANNEYHKYHTQRERTGHKQPLTKQDTKKTRKNNAGTMSKVLGTVQERCSLVPGTMPCAPLAPTHQSFTPERKIPVHPTHSPLMCVRSQSIKRHWAVRSGEGLNSLVQPLPTPQHVGGPRRGNRHGIWDLLKALGHQPGHDWGPQPIRLRTHAAEGPHFGEGISL